MHGFWRDVVHGSRSLLRNTGFTLAAVASLMLGIGANTAIFTLFHAVVLRPLPLEDLDRLVKVALTLRNESGEYVGDIPFSYPHYLDFTERLRDVEELAIYQIWPMYLTGGSEPQRVTGTYVSGTYFDLLRLGPARGRLLDSTDTEESSAPAAVLGHGCWLRLFGGDPGVLGRAVAVNGESLTIVGVAPRGFGGTEMQASIDVFLPLSLFERLSPYGHLFRQRDVGLFQAVGRLRDGVTVEQAGADVMDVARQLAREYPEMLASLGAKAPPLAENAMHPVFRDRYLGYAKRPLIGTVVLLIACLSVANLLFVRGLERARELAIRQALGAGRLRLLAQLVTENLLLFVIGALASLPVAKLLMKVLWLLRPPEVAAGALQLDLNAPMWAFTFAVALAVGLVFGAWPAFAAARTDLMPNLKDAEAFAESKRAPHVLRPRSQVVTLQVALALVALIGAGLLLRSLDRALDLDLGFATEKLAVLNVAPGEQGRGEQDAREIYRRLLERARALPGATAAALSQSRLLRGAVVRRQVYLPGEESEDARPYRPVNVVGAGFFDAVGIPLVAGRDFRERETEDRRVAIVNETMASALWPGREAIGRRFSFDGPTTTPFEVVGVAADARYRQVLEDAQHFIYLPLSQSYAAAMTVHVRTDGDPSAILPALRDAVHEIDPALAVADLATMRHFVDEALWMERSSAWLLSLFGALAAALALVGVYGLLAYSVMSRRRELGVRIALGARRGHFVKALVLEAFQVASLGVLIGLAVAAIALEPILSNRLYGVSVRDPATYAAWAAALLLAAVAGSFVPAWRAARTDPNETLRAE